ncbi:glycosyl transferase family/ helical bundle domain protein [Synechococcus sp. RS9915]|nr:glycosyl transferase family/ helical bundle domain protein [Synechococcus sp. RS9915]
MTSGIVNGRERFKQHLRKVGSGEHTSKGMSREEAADALHLMLDGVASPAQIGAFLIAHRIRRPEPQELAGMLDTYRRLGPVLTSAEGQRPPLCFGMPFDGRTRTAPIYPLTTLVLLACGQPVVLQGGNRMPIKYGVTAIDLFRILGLDLAGLSIATVQDGFEQTGFALIHQPDHFAIAESLIGYREELGKRPPVASLELLWTPHQGNHLLVSGFVHPPTESRAWEALKLAGETDLLTVKGLEGGTDLPIGRACITARVQQGQAERLILHPRDHGCHAADVEWSDETAWTEQALAAVDNRGPLLDALRWNAGAYLWFSGLSDSLESGLQTADGVLKTGQVLQCLDQLRSWRSHLSIR